MTLPDIIDLTEKYLIDTNEKKSILPNLTVIRRDTTTTFEAMVYQPVLCLILRGAKETGIGDQSIQLQAGDALLVSHDLPVTSKITMASPDAPYLALIISIDVSLIRSLYELVGSEIEDSVEARSLSAGPAEAALVEPLGRYLSLMDSPLEAQVLGPSILREIHFRLLISPIGGMLRNLLSVDSHASRIMKVIQLLRTNFREALSVSDLASRAGMSTSVFHERFKAVTGTTPLQYQKNLRLIEAQTMIANGRQSVSAVGFAVGYESPTHFSRDYTRKFGVPPSRDRAPANLAL